MNRVRPHPRQGESFPGYTLRLARFVRLGSWTEIELNRGIAALTDNLSEATLEVVRQTRDCRSRSFGLSAVETGTIRTPATWASLCRATPAAFGAASVGGLVLPFSEPNSHHRAIWDIALVNLCAVHLNARIDTFRERGARLCWLGADPARCIGRPDGDMRRMEAPDDSSKDTLGKAIVHGLLETSGSQPRRRGHTCSHHSANCPTRAYLISLFTSKFSSIPAITTSRQRSPIWTSNVPTMLFGRGF
jgi:hypothetical protein